MRVSGGNGVGLTVLVVLCFISGCSSVQTSLKSGCRPLDLGGRATVKRQLTLRLSGGEDEGDTAMEAGVKAEEPAPTKAESPKKSPRKRKERSMSATKRKGKSGGAHKSKGEGEDEAMPASESPAKKLRGKNMASAKKNPEKFSKRLKELVEKLSTTTHYTVEEPGEWEGKEATHVPKAEATDKGLKVTVEHVMNEETEEQELHYIEFIWIIDKATGEHLDIKQLFPKDKDAVVEFKGDFAGKEVVPYAMCNLHGIWRGSALAA